MRSSSVLLALATLSGVESRIEGQLERQHVIAPDTPTEVHEYYAPGIGGGSPDVTQQQASSDSKDVPNETWFPFGGGAASNYESGDSKAPVENQEKVPEAAVSRPTAFLQQPSQEVHEYYAPGIGGGSPDVTQQQASSDSKDVPNETWFPFGGGAASNYESGDSKAPVEHQEKVPEAAASRPTAFLQQPSQEVHEYYAPGIGGSPDPQVPVPESKSTGSETWFPFSAASASFKGDDAGLPEQGFHGEDVEHKDGETQTGDWGGEYQHPPEQDKKKASEATTQPPSAFLQEPTQEVREYYAPWFGSPDVSQVQQEPETKTQGNERWFPFAAASAPVYTEDKQ